MNVKVITVDGEKFEICERGRECDYRWVGGRHQGDYGFGSTRPYPGAGTAARWLMLAA